jgi:hypothetical protein
VAFLQSSPFRSDALAEMTMDSFKSLYVIVNILYREEELVTLSAD